MELNMQTLTLIGIVCVGVLVIVALIRRPKRGGEAGTDEMDALKAELESRTTELRDERSRADRFEAFAEERGTEIVRLNGDLSKLRTRLDEGSGKQTELSNTIARLEATMKAEREAAQDKIDTLTRVREEMVTRFRELAQEALNVQGEAFSKSNLEKLDAALTPLKEHVGHFEKALKTIHSETLTGRAQLKAEIEQLGKRSEAISQEAVALTRALRSDSKRQGAWGEMILETILERSGLRKGEEYITQAHRKNADGALLRPDVVVNIPGGKTLVIDAKVSLQAYTDAVNAETDEVLGEARKRHVVSFRTHINTLAGKDYQMAENITVDYVIMFVPIEGALSEALREDGSITEYALERQVTVATPTTLMMALRTVANVWAVERRSQNAERIAERAGRLYDKVVGFVDNMEAVGKRLGQAQDAYQNAFGQLSRGQGNLLSQVEKLKSLGARTTKTIGVDYDAADDTPQIADNTNREDLAKRNILYAPE